MCVDMCVQEKLYMGGGEKENEKEIAHLKDGNYFRENLWYLEERIYDFSVLPFRKILAGNRENVKLFVRWRDFDFCWLVKWLV